MLPYKLAYEFTYHSAIQAWMDSQSSKEDILISLRAFHQIIHEELRIKISFDRKIIRLISDFELRFTDETQMAYLRQLVRTLIKTQFVPEKEGQMMNRMLASIDYRADEYINNYSKLSEEEILGQPLSDFCEKIIRYKKLNTITRRFWDIVSKKVRPDIKSQMTQFIRQDIEKITLILKSIALANQLDKNKKCLGMIEAEMTYFKNLFQKFKCSLTTSIQLKIFGSTINGFGLLDSDLDISLETGLTMPQDTAVLQELKDFLHINLDRERYDIVNFFPTAYKPLLEIAKKIDKKRVLQIDFCVDNKRALSNCQMFKQYSQLSPTITQLGLLLKVWGKKCQLIKRFKLSSYAMLLMMIYFLIKAGILSPIKQKGCLNFQIGKLLKPEPLNLLELLINFLKFYSRNGEFFTSSERVISLDLKSQIPIGGKFKRMAFDIINPFDKDKNQSNFPEHSLECEIFTKIEQALAALSTSGTIPDLFI